MSATLYRHGGDMINAIESSLSALREWTPTIPQIRRTIEEHRVTALHLPQLESVAPDFVMPSQREVEDISSAARSAIQSGRMIDFGMLPNDVIKEGGIRRGPLYTKGALRLPFAEPWLFVHSWEHGVSIYLVNPLEEDKLAGGDCEVAELLPIAIDGVQQMLTIGDRVILTPDDVKSEAKYCALAIPGVFRYLPGAKELANSNGSPENAAAGNVLDPLMTALLILATRNIPRTTIYSDLKLAKARAKARKPPIPPYDVVAAHLYVTALMARRSSHGDGQGTHASPIAHTRRGHIRTYASGVKTWVRDALVNATEEARSAYRKRSHYEIKT